MCPKAHKPFHAHQPNRLSPQKASVLQPYSKRQIAAPGASCAPAPKSAAPVNATAYYETLRLSAGLPLRKNDAAHRDLSRMQAGMSSEDLAKARTALDLRRKVEQ